MPKPPERSDTPYLVWPGRRWAGRMGRTDGTEEHAAARSLEPFEAGDEGGRLVLGDALDVARGLAAEGLSGAVDLVYVDPPFASQADYVHEARIDGPADGRVVRAPAYTDTYDIGAYLEELAPRLEAMATLLAPTGSLWVHLDWRAAYMVRCVLDEIFGREAFVNEIVWRRAPNLGRQAASHQFGRTLDTILVYAKTPGALKLNPPTRLEPVDKSVMRWEKRRKGEEGADGDSKTDDLPFTTAPRGDYTDESIARLEKEGRVYRTPSGRVYVKYFLVKDARGKWCRERRVDALWTDIAPLRHVPLRERTGYPTQKPRALLERIVGCASPPGGLVVDLFAGSGTTGDGARAQGRRFILGDRSELAIATARARLAREGRSPRVDVCGADWRRAGVPDVTVEARDDGALAVTLRAPAEPAAWAIDAAYEPGRPFRSTWHSERRPGTKSVQAAAHAIVPRMGERIAVRVFADDGTLSEATFELHDALRPAVDVRSA